MTYRDDAEALLARVRALEAELARARKELEALRDENARLRAGSGALPVDRAALRALLEQPRRTVQVRVEAELATAPTLAVQAAVMRELDPSFYGVFEDGVLVLQSRRLRERAPIEEFCDRAFAALARIHARHPIARVVPRAR